jgi:hypothetical protein
MRAGKIDRPGVGRLSGKPERGHRLIEHRGTGRLADSLQQRAPADRGFRFVQWHDFQSQFWAAKPYAEPVAVETLPAAAQCGQDLA